MVDDRTMMKDEWYIHDRWRSMIDDRWYNDDERWMIHYRWKEVDKIDDRWYNDDRWGIQGWWKMIDK